VLDSAGSVIAQSMFRFGRTTPVYSRGSRNPESISVWPLGPRFRGDERSGERFGSNGKCSS
jgi:hypothetical protein